MKIHILFFSILVFFLVSCQSDSDRKWQATAQDFEALPQTMRPNPLWFWNNAEVKPDELKRQMADFKKAGYGGLSILPFGQDFKPKYLSDEYFDAYRLCVEEAEKLGLTLWIYDEYGFPSGTAGDINGDGVGRFKQKYPEHTNKRLDKAEFKLKPNSTFEIEIPTANLAAIVAMDTVSLQRIDLAPHIENGKLKWQVPEGNWKAMLFSCVNAGNSLVDYLSPEAAKLYINMTHDQYYENFSKYFGSTVKGTFFDEPTLYYADARTWTPDFNQKFEETYGFSPALYYPALWYDIGAETAEARNYMFGLRSELYAEGYIKEVNDWSKAHGILATGHQDNEEIINCVGTSGDFMKCFKYLDVPGIDKIGGDRPAERFYKIVSSAAYNWDHPLVMSETYGAMGNISWEEIFGIAMDQYVKGINVLIPHAVWYNTDNITFLPELSLRNPLYADRLNEFNDYLTRLNIMMQNDGRWVGDIAVLYPIHTMQSGHYLDGPLGAYAGGVEIPNLDYVDVSVNLFDNLGRDHLFLHPEVLDEKCSIEGGQLKLDNEIQFNSFSTLVVPACKTISLNNLKKIKQFAEAGGNIIFTTLWPEKSTVKVEDYDVLTIVDELKSNKNVSFVLDPTADNLNKALKQYPDAFGINFLASPVRNVHKMVNGKNIWFLANPDAQAKTTEFELVGNFKLKTWDPHTGKISEQPIEASYGNNKTNVKLEIPACYSLFLVED